MGFTSKPLLGVMGSKGLGPLAGVQRAAPSGRGSGRKPRVPSTTAKLRDDVLVQTAQLALHPVEKRRQSATQDVIHRLASQHRLQIVEPTERRRAAAQMIAAA